MAVLIGMGEARRTGGQAVEIGDGPVVTVAEHVAVRLGGADGVPLTTKELAVLTRLAHGETNAAIADALYISIPTVKTHLTHIYAKLGVGGRHEATSRAVALGLLH
jgi:ATP/maltotriose-dependent transcriptional regulator MalT